MGPLATSHGVMCINTKRHLPASNQGMGVAHRHTGEEGTDQDLHGEGVQTCSIEGEGLPGHGSAPLEGGNTTTPGTNPLC